MDEKYMEAIIKLAKLLGGRVVFFQDGELWEYIPQSDETRKIELEV